MVRPELEWKSRGRNALNWLTIAFAVALITVFLALWWTVRVPFYLLLALVFIVWLDIYFTEYWQPILYLVMSVILLGLLILWAVDGLWKGLLGQTGIVLNIVFLLLVIYLYYDEEVDASPG